MNMNRIYHIVALKAQHSVGTSMGTDHLYYLTKVLKMTSTHPTGLTVEVVGIEANSQGRSCELHETCGSLVEEDVVLRLRKVQVVVEGKEETAIAAYIVSDGVDGCRVGFLKRHMVKHWLKYEGSLIQVTEVFSGASESPTKRRLYHHNIGCCVAAVISSLPSEGVKESEEKSKGSAERKPKRIKKEEIIII